MSAFGGAKPPPHIGRHSREREFHTLSEAAVTMRQGSQVNLYLALSLVFCFVSTSATSESIWGRGLLAKSLSTGRAQATQSAPSTISGYTIRWVSDQTDPKRHSVEVTGLTNATLTRLRRSNWKLSDWQRLLRVQVEPKNETTSQRPTLLPPMSGTYRVEGNAIRFQPQYPLVPGLSYQASFRPAELNVNKSDRRELTAVVRVPTDGLASATVVTQVYPTADSLPENLLKFYVHFSAPMSRGHIYDYIRLLKEDGKQVELPFLEIDEELWDDTMTRLTIFIDPGRIKRGVLPLEEIGPALEAGKRYTLVIDRKWQDGAGKPLKESFQKPFLVGAPDREPPDPSQWSLQLPASGTQNPLVILFPEPMDNALTQRVIHITDASGKTVAGQIALTDQERRWSFQPLGPWKRGQHQLVVQTTIEDLAGNNIGKPFDVDLFEGIQRRLTNTTVKLPLPIQ